MMGEKMMGEMTERIRAGRETIGHSLEEMQDRGFAGVDVDRVQAAAIAAGVAAFAFAIGVGVMIYRRRRRRTLAERLQNALPDSMRDLPSGIKVRLKRAL